MFDLRQEEVDKYIAEKAKKDNVAKMIVDEKAEGLKNNNNNSKLLIINRFS